MGSESDALLRPPADLFLSLANGPSGRQTTARLPAAVATVLTLHVAGLQLTRLFALVEGKLSGKEVLSTPVTERLLRKRRRKRRTRHQRPRSRTGPQLRTGAGLLCSHGHTEAVHGACVCLFDHVQHED